MDRETCIIGGDCLAEELDRHLTAVCLIRHGGFAPQLSDLEVMTKAIGGALFRLSRDTDLFASCRAPSRSFFPKGRVAQIEIFRLKYTKL
jgi:hypothetical protein